MKNNHSTNQGSALMMAIVMTLLLFIIGTAFLMSARTDTQTVAAVDDLATSDNAVQAVIGQINAVLVGDLFGDDKLLLNDDASDEPYDYPGDLDPWLADLEPTLYTNTAQNVNFYGWRHITDLWDDNFAVPSGAYFFDPDNDSDPHQNRFGGNFGWEYWVYNKNTLPFQPFKLTVACIVSDNDRTEIMEDQSVASPREWLWGARADADGDGVADARWVPIPNITGPRGENCYTAVRIIDNCAMININTAFRNPGILSGTAGDWDGSRLSHINLDDAPIILANNEISAVKLEDIQLARFGYTFYNDVSTVTRFKQNGTVSNFPGSPAFLEFADNYACDLEYDNAVSRRILNPEVLLDGSNNPYYFTPFDLTDELHLRNRFFLYQDGINPRYGTVWPKTLNPKGSDGKKDPYTTNLKAWFEKCSSWAIRNDDKISEFYLPRHIATTYSFDRVITPEQDVDALFQPGWNIWNRWNANKSFRPVGINDFNASLPNYVKPTIETIAAAIWLGLGESTDLQDNVQFRGTTDTVFHSWTHEQLRERMACQFAANLIDYIDNNDDVTEINLGGGSDHYYGYEPDAHHLYISRLGISYCTHDPGTGPVPVIHHAIAIFNPGTGPITSPLTGWQVDVNGTIYTLPVIPTAAGTTVFFDNVDTTNSAYGFDVPDGTGTNFIAIGGATDFDFTTNDRITLLDPDGRPCDQVFFTAAPPAGSGVPNQRDVIQTEPRQGKQIGISPRMIYAVNPELTWNTTLFSPAPNIGQLDDNPFIAPNITPITAKIQLNHRKKPLLTLAEAYDVILLGAMNLNGNYINMPEFWWELCHANGDDLNANQLYYGRPNAGDPDFLGLLRYITVFSPFSDGIDNDGNGCHDQINPESDSIDNNGDGTVDNAGETYALYGEKDELAIAGRININTAPWFVIKQLPWLGLCLDADGIANTENDDLARAIVAYRDYLNLDTMLNLNGNPIYGGNTAPNYSALRWTGMGGSGTSLVREKLGFASIGELLNVTTDYNGTGTYLPNFDFRMFGRDSTSSNRNNNHSSISDPKPFYDPFASDTVEDDLLERDILLHRVSNLATVRSDVFTAYIAVRIGERGPIRRVMAIFDRSNVFSPGQTPRLVALQPVADPD